MVFQSGRLHLYYLLSVSFIFVSCAEKNQIPDSSLAVKIMRMQADSKYESDVPHAEVENLKNVRKIAFVSGVKQGKEQTIWSHVEANKPDAVVMVGNTVSSIRFEEKPLSEQYKKLDNNSDYRRLRQQFPFMAVWDELDYGIRNGDSEFQGKKENRDAFLDYWKYIKNFQSSEAQGVEHSVVLGPPGQRLQLIFLDTRYYVTPWLPGEKSGQFKKNWHKSSSLLGEAQWTWLASELRKPADYRVIVSPLQIAANSGYRERWGLFPLDRQRLFDTLRAAKARKVVVVSGGRGFGTFAKVMLEKGYGPLYDMTVGPVNYLGNKRENDFHYFGKYTSSSNFGLIEWDWERKKMQLKIVDDKNLVVQDLTLPF